MSFTGNILKMESQIGNPISYFFRLGEKRIPMNELIGKQLKLRFTGRIFCTLCGTPMKKSYGTGFCYNCTQTAPQADESVFHPELSKSQYGIYRDKEFAESHDLIEHVVYLALTNQVKVGVTRIHQVPTRWIDQGANAAIILAQTPNRHIAGIIESFLKNHFTDKTSWQAMLKNETSEGINLTDEKQRAIALLPAELKQYTSSDDKITELHYPTAKYPHKLNSLNFDKQACIEGTLTGIRGQYLYLDETNVINIRRHEGYEGVMSYEL
ncbi:MAG: DUF2797 domain-containing protein [Mangrovibacterium sp.]